MSYIQHTGSRTAGRRHPGRLVLLAMLWLVAGGMTLWAFGALHYDFPFLKSFVSWVYVLGVVALVVTMKGVWRKLATVSCLFALVLIWWLTQQPRHDRVWSDELAELPWADINGDEVTLHNVRNTDYRTASDFTVRWETRTVRLSQITGVDLAITYWGSPWMAHPIASFQFADATPVCFSIETRKEKGEKYSAIGGLYRQYELIFIAADERDAIRVRTNYRKGEECYLYRTKVTPDRARERFLEYVSSLNAIHKRPRWYNAITTNCTTVIRSQHPASERLPWDWRMLVNGKGDEMLYEQNALVTGGLSFPELKSRSLINAAARAADASPDFSRLIRVGLPGAAAEGKAQAP